MKVNEAIKSARKLGVMISNPFSAGNGDKIIIVSVSTQSVRLFKYRDSPKWFPQGELVKQKGKAYSKGDALALAIELLVYSN